MCSTYCAWIPQGQWCQMSATAQGSGRTQCCLSVPPSTIKGEPHGVSSVSAGVSPCWVLRIKIVSSSERRVGESFENFWVIEQAFSRFESQTISGMHSEILVIKWPQAKPGPVLDCWYGVCSHKVCVYVLCVCSLCVDGVYVRVMCVYM